MTFLLFQTWLEPLEIIGPIKLSPFSKIFSPSNSSSIIVDLTLERQARQSTTFKNLLINFLHTIEYVQTLQTLQSNLSLLDKLGTIATAFLSLRLLNLPNHPSTTPTYHTSPTMSDSTLMDVPQDDSIKQVQAAAPPREPPQRRASFVLENNSGCCSLLQHLQGEEAHEMIRKRRFSLRSHDSNVSLVSMASLASNLSSWGSSKSCFDEDESDCDSETTLSEQDLASLASREDCDHEEENNPDSDGDDHEDHDGDKKYACFSFKFESQACQLVQESWQKLQDLDQEKDDYKDVFGDTLLLCMMEIDPASRNALGISSFRSPRYGAMCRLLAEGLEMIIHALGASSNQQQQQEGQETSDTTLASSTNSSNEHFVIQTAKTVLRDWKRQGVNVRLLVQDALVYSIQSSLPPTAWSDQLDEAWQSTIVQMLQTLL